MRQRWLAVGPGTLALLVAGVVIGASCSSDSSGPGTGCGALQTSVSGLNNPITVNYSAAATGNGRITTLSYMTDAGTQTVQNPTLPWAVGGVNLQAQKPSLSANAVASNGGVSIQYAATGPGGTSELRQQSCSSQ